MPLSYIQREKERDPKFQAENFIKNYLTSFITIKSILNEAIMFWKSCLF